MRGLLAALVLLSHGAIADTPPAAVRRLHEAAVKGRDKPEARERIALQGMDPTLLQEKRIRESGAKVE